MQYRHLTNATSRRCNSRACLDARAAGSGWRVVVMEDLTRCGLVPIVDAVSVPSTTPDLMRRMMKAVKCAWCKLHANGTVFCNVRRPNVLAHPHTGAARLIDSEFCGRRRRATCLGDEAQHDLKQLNLQPNLALCHLRQLFRQLFLFALSNNAFPKTRRHTYRAHVVCTEASIFSHVLMHTLYIQSCFASRTGQGSSRSNGQHACLLNSTEGHAVPMGPTTSRVAIGQGVVVVLNHGTGLGQRGALRHLLRPPRVLRPIGTAVVTVVTVAITARVIAVVAHTVAVATVIMATIAEEDRKESGITTASDELSSDASSGLPAV